MGDEISHFVQFYPNVGVLLTVGGRERDGRDRLAPGPPQQPSSGTVDHAHTGLQSELWKYTPSLHALIGILIPLC